MNLRTTRGIANAVVALLIAQIVLLTGEAFALLNRIRLLERLRAGGLLTSAEIEFADGGVIVSVGLWLVVFIATAIVWCVWQHRAQQNAIELAYGRLQFTAGWAVGWWFVPFASLYKPFQTVRELWKASHGGYEGRVVATWGVIGWWWALWLASNALGRVSARAASRESIADFIRSDMWEIVANGASVVAAILAIMIVRSVVALQERAGARLFSHPLPPMPVAGQPAPELPAPPAG